MVNKSSDHDDVLTLRIGDTVVEFLHVHPGSFTMGSRHGLPRELPLHRVSIQDSFAMAKCLVTQQIWEAMMENNPAKFRDNPTLPVDSVSWDDASLFCARLSDVSGIQVRLPTEAEWEYACRARTDGEYFFGDNDSEVGKYAWYDLNNHEQTHPVGLKQQFSFSIRAVGMWARHDHFELNIGYAGAIYHVTARRDTRCH